MLEIILGGITATAVGAGLYFFIKKTRPVIEVLLCRDRNRTGETIKIEKDFAETMETDLDRKPVPMFFWKYRGGYAFNEGGHIVRRSFAKEGSAYTKEFEEGKEIKAPLSSILKAKVGEDFYKSIPAEQRKRIEDPSVFVLVDLEKEITPIGFEPLSSEDVMAEGDRKAARIYNKEMQEESKSSKGRILDVLLGFALATAIVLFAVVMGWIGGTPAPVTSIPTT